MSELMQKIVVGLIIAVAALYVGRRCWLTLRGRSGGCGIGCASCPSKKPSDKVVVELTDFRTVKR